MTQILVTLENGADTNLLQRMIENMKGVLNAKLQKPTKHEELAVNSSRWVEEMRQLSNSLDASVIDMNDERTRYIMSK